MRKERIELTQDDLVPIGELMEFLNETDDNQKKLIRRLQSLSIGQIENWTGLAFRPVQSRLILDYWEITPVVHLTPSPVSTIDSLIIWDEDGNEVTPDGADWEFMSGDDRIQFKSTLKQNRRLRYLNTLKLEYTSEFGDPGDDVLLAIQTLTAFHYDNRGFTNEMPKNVREMIAHKRVARIDAIGG